MYITGIERIIYRSADINPFIFSLSVVREVRIVIVVSHTMEERNLYFLQFQESFLDTIIVGIPESVPAFITQADAIYFISLRAQFLCSLVDVCCYAFKLIDIIISFCQMKIRHSKYSMLLIILFVEYEIHLLGYVGIFS